MKKLQTLYNKYQHGLPMLIYMLVYMIWFSYVEKINSKNYQIIHMELDDYIPFCELFIIPYLLWFGYVAITGLFLFFKNKYEFIQFCIFLIVGMTLFLFVSTIWPNGHNLRLMNMPRYNVFTRLVVKLWQIDTPTNICPSIHVYNSLASYFAISHCVELRNKKWIQRLSFVLSTSIILSTMFIKQHSVFDVITALGLGILMYSVVYKEKTHYSSELSPFAEAK